MTIKHSITDSTVDSTENSIIIIGNFNTPLSIMDRTTRQNINMEIKDSNSTVYNVHLETCLEYFTQQ